MKHIALAALLMVSFNAHAFILTPDHCDILSAETVKTVQFKRDGKSIDARNLALEETYAASSTKVMFDEIRPFVEAAIKEYYEDHFPPTVQYADLIKRNCMSVVGQGVSG